MNPLNINIYINNQGVGKFTYTLVTPCLHHTYHTVIQKHTRDGVGGVGRNTKTPVLRHFWGSSCFKANKFIAQQGNACPVEHLSFDSFNFIDCPFQHSIIQIDIHRILDSQLVSLYACGKFS